MEKPLTSVRRESMDLAGLLEEHGDHLLRLCTLYLGDRSQAEDAVQDTFLRALRAWPGFRGDCAVETWLVRIAINVCKRQLRSPWRLLRAPQESLDSLRMEEHGDHLLRLCTLYLGDRSQAEDAVQDTFLRALRAWPGFRGDCAVETWLVRIAINVCKRQLRSPWRLLRAPQESLDSLRMEGPEPPDDTLVRAIQALPPKYREVIILYYYQEWKAWEIAQRLHVPVSTVTVRLSRARGLLRERLKGWYYEQE